MYPETVSQQAADGAVALAALNALVVGLANAAQDGGKMTFAYSPSRRRSPHASERRFGRDGTPPSRASLSFLHFGSGLVSCFKARQQN